LWFIYLEIVELNEFICRLKTRKFPLHFHIILTFNINFCKENNAIAFVKLSNALLFGGKKRYFRENNRLIKYIDNQLDRLKNGLKNRAVVLLSEMDNARIIIHIALSA